MDKRFLLILVIVIAALGGVYLFSQKDKAKNTGDTAAVTVTNHTQGAGNKGVELIEYGDFQCPACGGFYPLLQQIKAQYGDDIKFVFRHFPLDSIHQNARAAHRAAEAAAKQDKFWEMHDMLYEQQEAWQSTTNPVSTFEGYATQLGLDMEKFKQDYQSEDVNKAINADIAAGQALRVASTPTFVLNGRVIDSDTQQSMRTLEGFTKIIDEEIAKQNTEAEADAPPVSEPSKPPAPAPAQ